VVRRALVALALAATGCGSFEEPSLVIDLRLLAMTAEPPEQVLPVDPAHPEDVTLAPVEVCALIADPGAERGLSWSMTACPPTGDRRCDDPAAPTVAMGGGALADPDTAATPQVACATLPAGPGVLAILQDTIAHDDLSGFGGVDLNVMIRVVPDGGGEASAVYGAKAVRFSPQLPAERVPNTNPTLEQIALDLGVGATRDLPLGRCAEQVAPLTLAPGQAITLAPIEPPDVREVYVVPTFEGGERTFTENLSYQWLAGAGDWSRTTTGGPRDAAGNQPPLDTSWEAPGPDDVGAGVRVPLWLIQRDERGGGRWFESCVQVAP
jgi:hypothetical protein